MKLLRVGVLVEDEVYRRGVMAVLNEDGCVCIDLGGDREMSPEAADAEDSLDVVGRVFEVVERQAVHMSRRRARHSRAGTPGEGSRGVDRDGNVAPRGPDQPAAPGGRSRRCGRPAGRVAEGWDIRRGRG